MNCRTARAGFELGRVQRSSSVVRESEGKNAFLGSKGRGAASGKNSLFPINTADSSRRASHFKCLFVFFHLQNFALKIYTSLFKNQTRSAKKKPIQNPEETRKGSKTQQNPSIKTLLPPLLYCSLCPALRHLTFAAPSQKCKAPCSSPSHTCLVLPLASRCRAQLASAFYDQALSKTA